MMKKKDTKSAIKEQLSIVLGIIKHKLEPGEYHVILLLMSLYRDGLMQKAYKYENRKVAGVLVNEMNSSVQYKELVSFYEAILLKFSVFYYDVFYSFLEIDEEVFNEHYSSLFESFFLSYYASQEKMGKSIFLSDDVTTILLQLSDLSADDKVYEPFANYASIGMNLPEGLNYTASEEYEKTWALGRLRLMAQRKSYMEGLHCTDSVRNWCDTKSFDCIISTPPMGVKFTNPGYGFHFPEYKTLEHFVIDKGLASLVDDGKMVLLFSSAFLYSMQWHNVRKRLIDEDLLEYVIALPKGVLHNSAMPSCIVVINKAKTNAGSVKVMDVSQLTIDSRIPARIPDIESISQGLKYEKASFFKTLSNEVVSAQNFNFSVGRYFIEDIPVDLADGEKLLKIGELASILNGQRASNEGRGKVLKVSQMSVDNLNYVLDVNTLEEQDLSTQYKLVSESCLLLSPMVENLKPTYLEYTGIDVFVRQDILALKIDGDKIDLAHLVNEFYSDYVRAQIAAYSNGAAMIRISREDLLNAKVKVTSLEEQKARVLDHKKKLIAQKEQELFDLRKESELYEADQISVLRHKVAGQLSNLKIASKVLASIVEHQLALQVDNIYNLKESVNSKLTLGKCLKMIERDLQMVSNAFINPEELKDKSEYERFDLLEFLKAYIDEIQGDTLFDINPSSMVMADGEFLNPLNVIFGHVDENSDVPAHIYVVADKTELRTVLDNLKENAVKHAFNLDSDDLLQDNSLQIKCRVNTGAESAQILVSNTGEPLPDGFEIKNYVRQGITSNREKGDGYGGYYIDRILRNLGSKIEVENHAENPLEDWASYFGIVTTFSFKLPIEIE